MRHRILAVLPALVLLALVGGVQRAEGQQPSGLGAVAQALTRYALTSTDLPEGARLTDAVQERTNELAAGSDPDLAPLLRSSTHLTGISQTITRSGTRGTIVVAIDLFQDAEGAWDYARDTSTYTGDIPLQVTIPGPAAGERSALIRYTLGGGTAMIEVDAIEFQRDRLAVSVSSSGPAGSGSVEMLLDLARAIDDRIVASPPAPASADELALSEEPTPAVVVRGAVRRLLLRYVEPVAVDGLLTEAWQGAAQALRRAGVADVPAPPAFPADEDAAIALHMLAFPTLERLAEGRISSAQLAYAAVDELARNRNDCHTYHYTPEEWQRVRAQRAGTEQPPLIGVSFSMAPSLRIVGVAAGSPAQAAGMRRGQIVLAINGSEIDGLTFSEARDLIKTEEGALNVFRLQNLSGSVQEITVAPARFRTPPLETEVVTTADGDFGVLRLHTFQASTEQVELMRAALEQFEAQGVKGWIVDLRRNSGGSSISMTGLASLFTGRGRMYGQIDRDGLTVYTNFTGATLPFQRPLAILVGPMSASAAEIMPGALQARGRAILVGERTAGCIGSTNANGLLDGSVFYVTRTEVVIGPDDLRLHRIGVTPNVTAPSPTPEDEEAGRDPQLAAALAALGQIAGDSAAPIEAPPPAADRTSAVVSF